MTKEEFLPEMNFRPWLLAIRPKTLPAAIAPVVMGTAMAFKDGVSHLPSAGLALFAALLVQIGTNLANDYFDFKKGADREDRLGPTRVTQSGLISPRIVLMSFTLVFLLAALIALYLMQRGGWPIFWIGLASVISGILYTAGPWPLGYTGWGEIFVLIFFGPVAVGGTYYLQSLEITPAVIVAGFGPGFLSAAILVVNNLRDIETDRRAGKRTLAVRFGRLFALGEYLFFILCASVVPVAVYLITDDYPYSLIALTIAFFAIPTIKTVFTKLDGPSLNFALGRTGQLLLLYSALFSVGWLR